MVNKNTMSEKNLTEVFTDIADAIREKDGTETTMTPLQMPQRILDAFGMDETATTPSADLPSVFQAIANSIRLASGENGSILTGDMASAILAIEVEQTYTSFKV